MDFNSAIREFERPGDLTAVVQGNTRFALDLYQQLAGDEGNLFFSPYSISTALAMTYAGARANTEAQMARTLHFSLDRARLHPAFAALEAQLAAAQEAGAVRLSVANALWPQTGYDLLPDYLALTKAYSFSSARIAPAASCFSAGWSGQRQRRVNRHETDLHPLVHDDH